MSSTRRRNSATAATTTSAISPNKSPVPDTAGAGAVTVVQVPWVSGRLQNSVGPSHALLQHTPSTQKVESHSAGTLQESPTGNRVSVGVTVGVAVGVAVGVMVGVSVGVSVEVAVGVALGVAVGVEVGVAVGVAVGVGVSHMPDSLLHDAPATNDVIPLSNAQVA